MFDIRFFKNANDLRRKIVAEGKVFPSEEVYRRLESFRDRKPFVFNIETTNVCNMTCEMCPRPNLMTRSLRHMDMNLFEKIIGQITPHSEEALNDFWGYISRTHGIRPEDRNENAFYFYTVARCVTLHGYGEPPLDPLLIQRIRLCRERGIPTYFSCVPANIRVDKFTEMMKEGATVIKFAMDALDDEKSREIRGKRNNFGEAYEKIMALLEAKEKNRDIKTTVVLTMIELSASEKSKQMQAGFMDLWKDKPVFAYIKSQDNRWLFEEDSGLVNKSHYESQYCEYPWTSVSVMADGSVVPCTQDYNNEMVLGNANRQSLEEIWNGKPYDNLRRWHISGDFPEGWKCAERCDQKMVCTRAGLFQRKKYELPAFA